MNGMSRNTHPDVAPPALYVPVGQDSTGQAQVVVANVEDGTRVLLAHTSLDRLLDCLGEDQGWALIMTDQLPRIKEDLRFDHLSVDHYVEPEARMGGRDEH